MKNIITTTVLCLLVLHMASCTKEFQNSPYGKNDGIAPGPVTNIQISNFNGGAYITYDLPSDTDVLYVKAVYSDSKDIEREVIVSSYSDTLKIEGLGDTSPRKVDIYTIDRYENQSSAVTATIEPLEPSVIATFGTLTAKEGFGGFTLDFKNDMRNPLSFYVYTWNYEQSQYDLYTVSTTSMEEGPIQFKGLKAEPTKFAIEVRDSYENISDKYEFDLTPINEEKLDKTKFKLITGLTGDASWNNYGGNPVRMWDDQLPTTANEFGHTLYPAGGFPHSFTIDLGTSAKLSEFALWPRQDQTDLFFAHGFPLQFGIYGCKDGDDYRDSANWHILYEGFTTRPSGRPFGDPNSEDDIQKGRDGHYFITDQDAPYIRYFRFSSYMSWSGMDCTCIAEISLWGDPRSIEQ